MRRGTIRCFSALRRVKTRNTRRTARLVRRERRAGPLEEEGGLVVLFHGFFLLFFRVTSSPRVSVSIMRDHSLFEFVVQAFLFFARQR